MRIVTNCLLCLSLTGALACNTDRDDPPQDPVGSCELASDCGEGDGRPGRRSEAVGIYDSTGNRMVMFGGSTSIPVNCAFASPEFIDETWAFHDRCGIWKQIDSMLAPSSRGRHMMAYDRANDRALLFGGRFRAANSGPYTNFNDVWQLDLTTDEWSEMPASTLNNPAPRVNGSVHINNEGDTLFLFGGNSSTNGAFFSPENDLWSFNLNTNEWAQLIPSNPPPEARLFHASLWDSSRERLVVFGGADADAFSNTATYFRDVWAYTPASNSWEQLHDGGGEVRVSVPAGRFWGEWVHDTVNDQYTLFGGHDDLDLGNVNDTWLFDPASNLWSLVTLGDTPNLPSNGFCDFPADFTNVDLETPERRNAHVLVYADGDCPALITSMGKTDCGAADDVQRFITAEARWEEMVRANEGEMCLRAEGDFDCFSMCD